MLIVQVHAADGSHERTLVLLDAAAYLPSHELNLTRHPADFVVASFYKMFGYPTGLGALVLRTEHVPQLNKVRGQGWEATVIVPTEQQAAKDAVQWCLMQLPASDACRAAQVCSHRHKAIYATSPRDISS